MVRKWWVLALALFVGMFPLAHAATEEGIESHDVGQTLLWIAVILIAAKSSSLVERFGQPSVLGEIVIGVVLGNLVLLGISLFEPIKEDAIIAFLAELGVVILLFQIGLESNIEKMKKVGVRALLVACLGVVIPFVLGTWVVGPLLLPGLSFNAYLFLGATLTATSVGITARVFRDLGKLQTPEAQIVLGAAVIDDVIGLIILAVISAIVTTGGVGIAAIGGISLKALAFLVGAIFLGQFTAPHIGHMFSRIHTGVGMKFTLAMSFCLVFAYLSQEIGLAPIVGAFAAGLVLDPVHFKTFRDPEIVYHLREELNGGTHPANSKIEKALEKHSERHVEELLEPVGHFLVPIFFVLTGVQVKLQTLFDPQVLFVALGITVVAFIGKVVSGLVAGRVNKWIVGWGMAPRGEVGLIFATIGKGLGVVNDEVFSVIVVVVILTTLLTPPILTFLLKKKGKEPALSLA